MLQKVKHVENATAGERAESAPTQQERSRTLQKWQSEPVFWRDNRSPDYSEDKKLNKGCQPPRSDELRDRLKETQSILDCFTEENSRLARENERLRSGGRHVAGRGGALLQEIDMLRAKLNQLEGAVLSGRYGILQNYLFVSGNKDGRTYFVLVCQR